MAKSTKAKTVTTKKAVKKPVVKRTTKRQVAKKTPASTPFMQVKITDQTIYWLIFGFAAIVFAIWLYSLDAKVRDLYDQIDANTYRDSPSLNTSGETNSGITEEQ